MANSKTPLMIWVWLFAISSAYAGLGEIDCKRFAVISGDANPASNCPVSFFSKTSMKGWDYEKRSVVADLSSVKLVEEVRMLATGKTATIPNVNSVALYVSLDNKEYTRVKDAKFELVKLEDGQVNWVGKFSGFKTYARYIKAHNDHSGTDTGFCSKTDCADMIKVFSSDPLLSVPEISDCFYPRYVETGTFPVKITLSGKPALGSGIKIVLENRAARLSKSFQFENLQQQNSFALDLKEVPAGPFTLAVYFQIDGQNAGKLLGQFQVVKKVWKTVSGLKSLDTNEIVLLRDTRQYAEGQSGHLQVSPYELPWGEKGLLSKGLNPLSTGFIVNWPVQGVFVLTAAVDSQADIINVQFGTGAQELTRFVNASIRSDPNQLREVYLGKFTASSDSMRIRVSLPGTGKLGSLRFERYAGPAWSGIERTRRVFVDQDGFSVFYMGMMKDANEMREYVSRYSHTDIDTVIWCVNNYMEVNYKSRYAPLLLADNICPRSGDRLIREAVNRFIDNGQDTLDCMLQACRDYDLKCLVSLRMNWTLNPTYDKNRQVELYEKFRPYFVHDTLSHTTTYPSYAYEDVRKQVLNIVSEIAYRNPDGILLEFTRSPPYVGFEPALVQEYKKECGRDLNIQTSASDPVWLKIKSRPLTELVTKVRQICTEQSAKSGKKIQVAIHVPNTDLRFIGIDIETWARLGLIDIVIIGDGMSSSRVCDAVKDNKAIEMYACINAHYGGHDPTPEEDKAEKAGKKIKREMKWLGEDEYFKRTYEAYEKGFDGVDIWDGWSNFKVITSLGNMDRVHEKINYELKSADTAETILIK